MLTLFPILMVLLVGALLLIIPLSRAVKRRAQFPGNTLSARLVGFSHIPARGRGSSLSAGSAQPVVEYSWNGATRTLAAQNHLSAGAARAWRPTGSLTLVVDPANPNRVRIAGFKPSLSLRHEGTELAAALVMVFAFLVPIVAVVVAGFALPMLWFPLGSAGLSLAVLVYHILSAAAKKRALSGEVHATPARVVNILTGYSSTWLTLAIQGPDGESIENEAILPTRTAGDLVHVKIGDTIPAIYPAGRPKLAWPAAAPLPKIADRTLAAWGFVFLYSLAMALLFSFL